METAIQVIWWIGLIGALIPTLVIVKLVMNVLRTLEDILELSTLVREASRGVSSHTEAVSGLAAIEDRSRRLRETSAELPALAASIDQELAKLTPAASSR